MKLFGIVPINIMFLNGIGMNIRCGKHPVLLFLVLISIVNGCIFPVTWKDTGYEVVIDVRNISKGSINMIDQILISKDYHLTHRGQRDGYEIIQYSKTVVEGDKIKDPNVTILVLCNISEDIEYHEKCSISAGNWYHAENEKITEEIDQIGNMLYSEITNIVGLQKVDIIRRSTGPPF